MERIKQAIKNPILFSLFIFITQLGIGILVSLIPQAANISGLGTSINLIVLYFAGYYYSQIFGEIVSKRSRNIIAVLLILFELVFSFLFFVSSGLIETLFNNGLDFSGSSNLTAMLFLLVTLIFVYLVTFFASRYALYMGGKNYLKAKEKKTQSKQIN